VNHKKLTTSKASNRRAGEVFFALTVIGIVFELQKYRPLLGPIRPRAVWQMAVTERVKCVWIIFVNLEHKLHKQRHTVKLFYLTSQGKRHFLAMLFTPRSLIIYKSIFKSFKYITVFLLKNINKYINICPIVEDYSRGHSIPCLDKYC